MKNIIALALIYIFSFESNAQIYSGALMSGGSATFNIYNNNNTSSTSLIFSPQFGIAFADDFIGGAWFSFSSFNNTNSWSFAPFIRYYKNYFFSQLGYGYNRSGNVGQSVLDIESGYAIFLTDNVALEPSLYYNQYFNNGFNGSDIGAKIGFQIYLNR